MAAPLPAFIPAGINSVPRASFSRRPGGDCSFTRGCVRVCSTIGDGFCGCWACTALSPTAQISNSRMGPDSALAGCRVVFRQVAMMPAVIEVHDEANDQPHDQARPVNPARSEEHTFELQSRQYLVCRLLLE